MERHKLWDQPHCVLDPDPPKALPAWADERAEQGLPHNWHLMNLREPVGPEPRVDPVPVSTHDDSS